MPSSAAARALLLAGTVLGLVVLALVAGRIGPWVAEPRGGGTAEVPVPPPPPTLTQTAPVDQIPPPQSGSSGADLLGKVVVIALILIVVGLTVWILVRTALRLTALRRERFPAAVQRDIATVPEGLSEPPDDGAGASVRRFDARAAADEIIACWAGLEQAAAQQGRGRRPEQTPTEFLDGLRRRDDTVPDRATQAAADVLLRLYHRARFDHQALGPESARQARGAARLVVGLVETPSADGQPGPAGGPAGAP